MINEKYCRVLELDKILSRLAEYGCCDTARERILAIRPETSLSIVLDETAKTDDAFVLSSKYGTPSFQTMEDPEESLRLAERGGVLSPHNLLNIASVLRETRLLSEWRSRCENRESALAPLFDLLLPDRELERRIESVFLSEEEMDDHASPELAEIRRKIKSLGLKIKDDLDRMIRSSTYQKALQENIVTMRDGRYVLPVKAEYKGAVNGLVHDTSSTGSTLFIEPMSVVEANNDIRVLKSKEKAEIERILAELSSLCGDKAETIGGNFEVIIRLNIYFAKADLAASMKASRPQIGNDGRIRLNRARHPLIPKESVVPINLELGCDYTSLVITGPNTGGKTVTLKTIGLLTLMTMCGMLIPVADGSVISIFDKVLVDIGDEQSIAQSLSTFSAHMTNIVSILREADSRSLILVDELGSGTDPVEGAALATAILEQLRERKAITAATTHYAELKVYALQTEGVVNASCEFDVKTLRPTYRLLIGTPGRSNAFEISRRLGLPDDILQKARGYVASDKKNFEDVIDGLETARQEFEEKTAALAAETAALKKQREELRNTNLDAINEKERIIEKARQEARTLVEHVKLDSQTIIDELEKVKRQKDKAEFSKMVSESKARLRGKIGKLSDQANPVQERTNEDYVLPRKLKKGDVVLLVDIDKEGVVLQESDNSGSVLVQAGIIKSRVPVSNLRLLEKPKTTFQGKTTRTVTSNRDTRGSMELDLRGMASDEAILELDMFVNRALMSHLSQTTIIHGKGTGVLRSAVHDYLRKCKQVKSFRLGVYGEGESGVTIVEFK